MKGWEKTFCPYGNLKKAEIAILISNKINFQPRTVKRDQKSHYNNKGANPSGDYKINKYVPKIGAPQYIRRILTNLKGE